MVFDLSYNRLSGPIPKDFLKPPGAGFMYLRHNQLSGTIPAEFSQMSDISVLDLGDNQLSGPIPPELGQMHLVMLILNNNKISGVIPETLANINPYFDHLDLRGNRISGPLPPELSMAPLTNLYLGDNPLLFGPLPESYADLNLDYFFFNNTPLCEPEEAGFQSWLAGIPHIERTGVICAGDGPYSISGKVTGLDQLGLAGVIVADNFGHWAETGEDGSYVLEGISAGTVLLVAVQDAKLFEPEPLAVTVVDASVEGADFQEWMHRMVYLPVTKR